MKVVYGSRFSCSSNSMTVSMLSCVTAAYDLLDAGLVDAADALLVDVDERLDVHVRLAALLLLHVVEVQPGVDVVVMIPGVRRVCLRTLLTSSTFFTRTCTFGLSFSLSMHSCV